MDRRGGAHRAAVAPLGDRLDLVGCGIRWVAVAFLGYDSTFGGLECPPLFVLEGPDGGRVRVAMDRWASGRSSYTQGAAVLSKPEAIEQEWLPRFASLGAEYPLRAVLASGTHGDISPGSGGQARGFAGAIARWKARPGAPARLVNATLPQFCRAADEAEARAPFLKALRGCFSHSWDLWPVSLARHAAAMREGERRFLAAEALLAAAALAGAPAGEAARARRERAEWCWAMLADHAWNGTDDKNRRHNASLRRRWGEELEGTARSLIEGAWSALGLEPAGEEVALFNPLSFPRSDLARLDAPEGFRGSVEVEGRPVPSQVVEEDGKRVLCFVAPDVPAFGFSWARLVPAAPPAPAGPLRAAPGSLEGPRFRLAIDPRTGGIASLVHVPSGAELVAAGAGRSLGETSWVVAGKERPLAGVRSEVAAEGPVLARLRVRAAAPGLEATTLVTLYAELDRVDLEMRLRKEPVTEEERLCHVFPVLREGSVLRVETTGAVVRPRREPEGDLLPGADPRRIAVQGFADASAPGRPGTTVIPLDAFALRLDLGGVALEALGNDQNPKEVTRDQDGVRDFAFRYSLRGHAGGYDGAAAFAGSRDAACPLLAARGRLPAARRGTGIALDPARAIATCLKPADDEPGVGCILRLWETSGRAGPLRIDLGAAGVRRAVETDLLERDRRELELSGGAATLDLRAHGFAAVRLVR